MSYPVFSRYFLVFISANNFNVTVIISGNFIFNNYSENIPKWNCIWIITRKSVFFECNPASGRKRRRH